MNELVIRTSDRGIYKNCRRKWDFHSKLRQGYQPLVAPEPFEFGTAIHAALEVYYEPDFWEADRSVIRQAALQCFRDVVAEHRRNYLKFIKQEDMSIEKEEEFEARLTLGTGMLEHYFEWAPTMDNFTPRKVEIEFEVPVLDPQGEPAFRRYVDDDGCVVDTPIVYQGRVDLLIEDQRGHYWIVDHKTAAQFGGTDHLDMDEQCGSYIWALRRMLQLPIAGVIYNQLLKSVPKPPSELVNGGFSKNRQQRTTYEVYLKTLKEYGENLDPYMEFLEFLKDKGNTFFRRLQVNRTPYEITQLGHQIYKEAMEMTNPVVPIYPNPGMFNCMGCAYRQPCMAINDGSDVNWILNEQYIKETDNDTN